MELVVVAKAVPALDALEFDPVGRVVRRDRGPLFLNPFDARAVRVALDLRGPGDRVTVVSLGPPGAAAPLREAKAAGADRVVLISDPRCAASDTLATATVLAAAIRLLRPSLVLAGAWTTDSETGQVVPELAALLGWPVVPEARAFHRGSGLRDWSATVDTETGWAELRGDLPVVVSVGEKIAKPPKPSADSVRAVDARSIERWTADDVAVAPSRLGAAGSPTSVGPVREAAPSRAGRRFDHGSLEERAGAAVAELARRLGAPPAAVDELPLPPARRPADREVLVLVTGPHGDLDRSSLGAVVAVRRRLPDAWPSVLWIGGAPTEEATQLLARSGALAGYLVPSADRPVDAAAAGAVAEELVVRRPELAAFLFPPGAFGRTVAGTLAARRGLGLVGDAIDVAAPPGGPLAWAKPSFGGRTIADIRCRTRPALATFRGGGFAVPERGAAGGFGWTPLSIPLGRAAWPWGRDGREIDDGAELDRHDTIVAVGLGIGGPDGIARLRPTIDRWGAGLAGTRKVVDAGWLPRQLQVGLTGRSLAPRLAVLLGVSGAVNHAVGWQRAGAVLAVNRDPAAPVFSAADVGIVGAVEELLPLLEGPVARLLGR